MATGCYLTRNSVNKHTVVRLRRCANLPPLPQKKWIGGLLTTRLYSVSPKSGNDREVWCVYKAWKRVTGKYRVPTKLGNSYKRFTWCSHDNDKKGGTRGLRHSLILNIFPLVVGPVQACTVSTPHGEYYNLGCYQSWR